MQLIHQLKTWPDLVQAKRRLEQRSLPSLFEEQPSRFDSYHIELDGLLLDYSKNLFDHATLQSLLQLCEERHLRQALNNMMEGELVNTTESRAALHTALRLPRDSSLHHQGIHVSEQVSSVLARMAAFSNQIREGLAATSDTIRHVIHIGIGGSHLGPQMIHHALSMPEPLIQTHFIANIDGSMVRQRLSRLNPAQCLVLIASKTFSTQETMINAHLVRQWLQEHLGHAAAHQHLVAICSQSSIEKARNFGVPDDQIFELWDWVGGRYSLWSAVGLPIMLAHGPDCFFDLLAGAHAADRHLQEAPYHENMPVIMALLSLWYIHFYHAQTHAVLPYDERLSWLPAYLQQLEMESNGKSVTQDGTRIDHPTSMVVWGATGTCGQHAFHQLLHQGRHFIPVDFWVPINHPYPTAPHDDMLFANAIAQSQALMLGRYHSQPSHHQHLQGSRPSNTFLYQQLDAKRLGQLCAIYEHKTVILGMLWGINPFDQWGVEFGKELCENLLPVTDSARRATDSSTAGLVNYYLKHQTKIP